MTTSVFCEHVALCKNEPWQETDRIRTVDMWYGERAPRELLCGLRQLSLRSRYADYRPSSCGKRCYHVYIGRPIALSHYCS